ncbi:hypothetical protein GIB67_024052 [Kingdonia uniflora]|uniref:Pentatricopeptide repeat-containing protein n=1 Tax=Kingdonia uniflora TaxID=39325 RepID=A0A7J7LAV8_9MAGN|nr:hypothetical protein GIB67_024052 [Kingdonia uniflora]
MLEKKVEYDNYTYPILVQASAIRLCETEGREIHNHVLKLGFDSDVYVRNTLINMYCVCGNMSSARRVFDCGLVLDSVSWNSILAGYIQIGDVELSKVIFDQMPVRNVIISNSMILLFGKKGRVSDARGFFDSMSERDMVTWSAMVSCYEQNGEGLLLFSQMNNEGVMVDEVVMVSVLSVCKSLDAIKEGKLIHGRVLQMGIESYVNCHAPKSTF